MPTIRPWNDLSDRAAEIAALAHAEREPVFITKDGYADLVVMSAAAYEQSLARLEIYDKIAASQAEVASGARLLPLEDVFLKYRGKYKKNDDEML